MTGEKISAENLFSLQICVIMGLRKSLPPRGRGTALAVEGACVTFDLHKFHCNALSLTRQGTPLRYVASFLAKTWSGAPSRREPFSGSVYGGSTRSPVRNPSAPLGHLPLHRGGGASKAPTPPGTLVGGDPLVFSRCNEEPPSEREGDRVSGGRSLRDVRFV